MFTFTQLTVIVNNLNNYVLNWFYPPTLSYREDGYSCITFLTKVLLTPEIRVQYLVN